MGITKHLGVYSVPQCVFYSVHLRTGSVHITGQFTDYSTADMWQMKAILDMFIFLSDCDAVTKDIYNEI